MYRDWYEPYSFTVISGYIHRGDIYGLYVDDDVRLILNELDETPGFIYDVEFRDVPNDEAWYNIVVDGYHEGSGDHFVKLQQYNYDTLEWINLTTNETDIPTGMDDSTSSFRLYHNSFDDGIYIQSGELKIRIIHTSAGNNTHFLHLDKFVLESGSSRSSSSSSSSSASSGSSASSSSSRSVPSARNVIFYAKGRTLSFSSKYKKDDLQ